MLLKAADHDGTDAVLGSNLVGRGFFPEHFQDYLGFTVNRQLQPLSTVGKEFSM
jgi:hypothetical protein